MTDMLQLTRIEAKLDRLLAGPQNPVLSLSEAMRLTGSRSRQAFQRMVQKWGVHSFIRGKYRRVDLENAMGREALRLGRRIANDIAAETVTEGRIRTKPQPLPQ